MSLSSRLWRILTVGLIALTAVSIESANRPNDPRTTKPSEPKITAILDADNATVNQTTTRSLATAAATVDSRGALVAQTWRDWQSNSSIGRTVDFNSPASSLPAVQFTYMYKASAMTVDRTHWGWAAYEAVSGGFVPPGGFDVQCRFDPPPPGFCQNMTGSYPKIAVDATGRALLGGREQPDVAADPNLSQLRVTRDVDPMVGDFGDILSGSVMAESIRNTNSIEGAEVLWPTMDISEFGGVTTIYLAAYENVEGPDAAMKVFRKVGWSEANPDNSWELVFVDTAFYPSQDISCSRVSAEVAVSWTKMTPAGHASGNSGDADIWYAESPTGASGTWTKANLTNYSGAGYRAWIEVSSLYDSQGKLHLIWNASKTDGADFGSRRCRIFHWSQWLPSTISTVYQAEWDPLDGYCLGGSSVMNVGKFSLAECKDRLFTVFSSFNDPLTGHVDDCCSSAPSGEAANGEIFVSSSADLQGTAWDLPRNISGSYTPTCDTGNCADDRLLGVSRYGMDQTLYVDNDWSNAYTHTLDGSIAGNEFIQIWYQTDRYPGGGILTPPQGPLTINDMRWIRLACNSVPNCRLIASPAQIGFFPIFFEPGQQHDIQLSIFSQCSQSQSVASISAEITDGPVGWLATSNGPSSIDGGDSAMMIVHLNQDGIITSEGIFHGRIIVRYGSPLDSLVVPVELRLFNQEPPYYVRDTITSQCGISLIVNPTGNMGDSYFGGANMNFPQPSPECDTGSNSRGDASIYLGDASPVIIRKPTANSYVASWSIFANGFASENQFVPLATSSPRGSFAGVGYDGYNTGTFCTVDSLVKIEKTLWAPTGSADSCNFILQRMRIFPFNNGQSVTNLAIAEAFDWDIPSDSASNYTADIGGTDPTRRLVYMRGFNSADGVVDCYNNSLRYGGAAVIKMHMKDCVPSNALYAGYNAANDTFVYPAGGFVPAQQWNQMQIPGYSNEPRITDLHSMLVYKNQASTGWTLPANDTLTIWTAMAVTRPTGGTTAQGLDSLKKAIDKAAAWSKSVMTTCQNCCVGTTGDVNMSGGVDLTDLSFLIGAIINPPVVLPCPAEANINASPAPMPDLSDISLLIAYLTVTPRPTLPNCPSQ